MTSTDVVPELGDRRRFPVDLNVPKREFAFLPITVDVLDRSVFIDTRIEAPLSDAQSIPAELVSGGVAGNVGWLFHTSFCCSTLLARALHVQPAQVVLKEPLVLRRLADARNAGWATDGLLPISVALLGSPWGPGGSVVIKPTHAALNIASDLMDAAPGSRAVLLTSSLEDFVVSHLKKTRETLQKIPQLAERALRIGGFHRRLPADALSPPDLLCAATLQWAAQRELCLDLILDHGRERIRTLSANMLLEDVAGIAVACSRWLGGSANDGEVRMRAAQVSGYNAKAIGAPYNASQRSRDAMRLRALNGNDVVRALSWFERTVLPVMRHQAVDLDRLPEFRIPEP